MKICIVIPFYNHPGAIAQVVDALKPLDLPCRIVDDGSDEASQGVLAQIAAREDWVSVQRLPANRGKGGAVMAGCDAALAAGFTHALQIDADGQHDAADVPRLLEQAQRHPQALVSGHAVYDESVPRSRLYGRYLTHVWVWINTLSFEIRDSMCGLRVYPLAPTCAIWRRHRLGRRMDFDTEILVRLSWSGVAILSMPTRVTYPADGVSHFKLLKDNVYISLMHARLFAGMLLRLPLLLGRRVRQRMQKVAA
ncbi:MAG TPA: glycosyltransferase family 2 protein [Povalibacter sp.]|uniref:glycosyltransferase family 2 protein n=1 Tax=Povalibacter sp. TaxID=1962978 RepID=UPI002C0AE511|nr:glycosyltransferase family 2 protein [Povalibacter sp.]HMN44780.1 glycosyltransferase family 2 protein [Povalibacter sp.]